MNQFLVMAPAEKLFGREGTFDSDEIDGSAAQVGVRERKPSNFSRARRFAGRDGRRKR